MFELKHPSMFRETFLIGLRLLGCQTTSAKLQIMSIYRNLFCEARMVLIVLLVGGRFKAILNPKS